MLDGKHCPLQLLCLMAKSVEYNAYGEITVRGANSDQQLAVRQRMELMRAQKYPQAGQHEFLEYLM